MFSRERELGAGNAARTENECKHDKFVTCVQMKRKITSCPQGHKVFYCISSPF